MCCFSYNQQAYVLFQTAVEYPLRFSIGLLITDILAFTASIFFSLVYGISAV